MPRGAGMQVMNEFGRPISILIADDDAEDRELTQAALADARLENDVFCVSSGEELLDFLLHRGEYQDFFQAPRPGLILLDLKMPGMDGLAALQEIKQNADLARIPVVILTGNSTEETRAACYALGANHFIPKPVTFESLILMMRSLGTYWFAVCRRTTAVT
jgi:CheY-like chemotaxis protein